MVVLEFEEVVFRFASNDVYLGGVEFVCNVYRIVLVFVFVNFGFKVVVFVYSYVNGIVMNDNFNIFV